MADLEDIYKKFFDESGNMKESGKKIVSEGMKGINKASADKYVSKAPAVKIFDEATKLGPKDYLKSSTKTLTEQGFFQPKSLKAAETIGKAAKATRIGKIAAGVAAAGYGVKKYLESKMSKPEAEDVEKKSKGGMNKYSTGKQIKLSDALKKSDLPKDYFKSLGLFPFVPREEKEDVEKKSTGDYIKRRKKLAGVDSLDGDDMSDTSDYIKRRKKLAGVDSLSTGKSVKGYGQARKSGMGLEDENISLGKGSDYIKDLL